MEIQVLRSTNRITLEITLEEWSAIEQKTSLSLFQQNQGHQIAVQEHQRTRHVVSQVKLYWNLRLDTKRS